MENPKYCFRLLACWGSPIRFPGPCIIMKVFATVNKTLSLYVNKLIPDKLVDMAANSARRFEIRQDEAVAQNPKALKDVPG